MNDRTKLLLFVLELLIIAFQLGMLSSQDAGWAFLAILALLIESPIKKPGAPGGGSQ